MYDLYSLTEKINKESEEEEKVKIETAKPILCSSKGDTVADKIDTAAKKSRDKIVGLEIVSKTDNLASKKESRKRLDLCFLESDNASRKNRGLAKSSGDDATKIDEAVASSFMDKMTDKNTENTVEGIKEARSLAYAPPIECQRRRRRGGEKNTEVADNEGGNPKQRKKEHRLELGLPFANEAVRRFAHGNTTTEASDIFAGNQNSEDICTIPPPKKGHMLELAPPFANEDVRRFACGNTTAEASDILVDNQNSGDISIIPPPGAFNIVPGYEPEERLLEVLFKDEETIAHIIDNSSPAVCEIKIPEAKLVDEVPEALLVKEDGERTEEKKRKLKRYLILSIIIIIIFLAILIPVVSISFKRPREAETIDSIIAKNFPKSKHKMLNTPQYYAFNWLTNVHGEKEEINEREILSQYGLYTLYLSTNGNSWTKKTNWMNTTDECSWYGVTCGSTGEIIELDLSHNNLEQAIPQEISTMTDLKKMNFTYNGLTGISSSIAALKKLQSFEIYHNENMGRIPLEVIDLLENSLTKDEKKVSEKLRSIVTNSDQDYFVRSMSNQAFEWIVNQSSAFVLDDKSLAQQYCLSVLYFNSNGKYWTNKTDWLQSRDECDWYGVQCMNGDVIELKLAHNNVSGTVALSGDCLGKLKILDLSQNSIQKIDSNIGLLENLTVLFEWKPVTKYN